jgi:hypothetical protein
MAAPGWTVYFSGAPATIGPLFFYMATMARDARAEGRNVTVNE